MVDFKIKTTIVENIAFNLKELILELKLICHYWGYRNCYNCYTLEKELFFTTQKFRSSSKNKIVL